MFAIVSTTKGLRFIVFMNVHVCYAHSLSSTGRLVGKRVKLFSWRGLFAIYVLISLITRTSSEKFTLCCQHLNKSQEQFLASVRPEPVVQSVAKLKEAPNPSEEEILKRIFNFRTQREAASGLGCGPLQV